MIIFSIYSGSFYYDHINEKSQLTTHLIILILFINLLKKKLIKAPLPSVFLTKKQKKKSKNKYIY